MGVSYERGAPVTPTFLKVTAVACGARHTLAVNAEGEVFSWGLNHEGQLGHGGRENLALPKRIQVFMSALLIRNTPFLGPYSRSIPRVLWWS